MKIKKLNIEEAESGVNLDVEGAPEGIHIEWEILPQVIQALAAVHVLTEIQKKGTKQ